MYLYLIKKSITPVLVFLRMKISSSLKIKSILHLYQMLPDEERIIVDVLRQLITENLPAYAREKISYNVPFFYGNKGICIIWPSTIPRVV